jgi:hypothetical protein
MTSKIFQIRFFPSSFKDDTNAIAQTAMKNSKPDVDFDIEITTVIDLLPPYEDNILMFVGFLASGSLPAFIDKRCTE